ncbi:hypothetical protein GK047_02640 [Paenibacillus sp. SYP-B3998]|uniref:Copper amine oxidase-like N-terminal domain-containing protein n=1 Tax=Paenibacillus sp. SYP-B3998 TaxID=2678564 RepID=A0A6G3ZS20_9BACL|nr:stalk domain-containing protein [Paenibacillus sp. SYP-B3998]NEW04915.1 hypothetical protein [Paenibacillus sp. SYP-B3998]
MKTIQMKKSVFVSTIVAASLIFGSVGVFASSGLEKIQAFLNHDIKFTVDGKAWTPTDSDGNELTPIIYDGSSYVPAKAVAEKMGGSVKWDASSQTIRLTTSSNKSTDGVPYKDGGSSSTPSKPAPSPDPVDVPSGDGVMVLGDKEATTAKMKEQAVAIIKLYGDALETGSTAKFDAYVDKFVAEKRDHSPISLGRQYYKDEFKKKVKGAIAVNDTDKITDYAKTMKAVKSSDVEVYHVSNKTEFSQSFEYNFYPKDWSAFSSVYVHFTFSADQYDSNNFILEEVRIS